MFKQTLNYLDNLFFGKPPILKKVVNELHHNQHALLDAQNTLEWAHNQVNMYQKRIQRLKDQKNELEKMSEESMANLKSNHLPGSTY